MQNKYQNVQESEEQITDKNVLTINIKDGKDCIIEQITITNSLTKIREEM